MSENGTYKYRISQECQERAIGKEWTFARFSMRVWERLADYGLSRLPNPLKAALEIVEEVSLKDAQILRNLLAQDQAEFAEAELQKRMPKPAIAPRWRPFSDVIWEKAYAQRSRYLQAGSPELQGLMDSHEGNGYLFYLLLRSHHPDITEEVAYDVYWDLFTNGGADGRRNPQQVIAICNGTAPESLKNASTPAAGA